MTRFVLDASVTLSWLIDRTPDANAIRIQHLLIDGRRAVVPALWILEVANGFISAERRGMLTPADSAEILSKFELALARSIEVIPEPIPIRRLVPAARESGLTTYDVVYLELAREQHLPLATLDRSLAKASQKAGVTLLH